MVNRQRFGMGLGLFIVVAHVCISVGLWFFFSYGRDDGVFLKEISLPLTLGYSIAVVKWFLDNHGIVTSEQVIGWPLVVLVILITGAFIGGLVIAPIAFVADKQISVDQLNNTYVAIESAFGGMFSLIFSYLYGAAEGGRNEG